ncbi:MAG: ABC transporter ATP-binding protein [Bdellovibrionales bacterium]
MLSVRGLTKSFDRPVLQDVAFDVQDGEIVALLGASGGGKTTLLRILAGLEKEDAGAITGTLARPSADIGYMGQSAPLAPWLNSLENALLPSRLAGRPVDAARAADFLFRLQLEAEASLRPQQLSGGMQQRVLLAGMLTLAPRLYLLDEPLGQLDIPLRRHTADIVRKDVRARKAAAIIVTHSIEEALFIADRILVLGGNRPSTIVGRYAVRTPLEGHATLDEATAYHTLLAAVGGDQVAA